MMMASSVAKARPNWSYNTFRAQRVSASRRELSTGGDAFQVVKDAKKRQRELEESGVPSPQAEQLALVRDWNCSCQLNVQEPRDSVQSQS